MSYSKWLNKVKFTRYLPYLIGLISVLIFVLLLNMKSDKQAAIPEEKIWRVAVVEAKYGDFSPTLTLHGTTESPHRALLETTISANVIATPAYEGVVVNKGDLLIQLDGHEATLLVAQRQADVDDWQAQKQAELTRAKADQEALAHEQELYTISKREFERQKTLVNKKLGSPASMDTAKRILKQAALALTQRKLAVADHKNRLKQLDARLARAKALLAQAKLDYSRSEIRAPFAGRITKLRVAPGNRVQAGETLIEIYDTSNIEIRAQIPSQHVRALSEALQHNVSLNARARLDGQLIRLSLSRLAGEVGQGRGGVDGLFKLSSENARWALGRSMEIILAMPVKKNVIKVPSQSVYGADRIYLAKNGRMHSVQVKVVGLIKEFEGPSFALISADEINVGDAIITTQLPNARTGLRVNIIKDTP